jgi:hypothetical protein
VEAAAAHPSKVRLEQAAEAAAAAAWGQPPAAVEAGGAGGGRLSRPAPRGTAKIQRIKPKSQKRKRRFSDEAPPKAKTGPVSWQCP